MHQTLKNLLYTFVASEGLQVQQNFPLGNDLDYQRHATIELFLLICEKLIYKWQQVQFQNNKRALGPSDASRSEAGSTIRKRLQVVSGRLIRLQQGWVPLSTTRRPAKGAGLRALTDVAAVSGPKRQVVSTSVLSQLHEG